MTTKTTPAIHTRVFGHGMRPGVVVGHAPRSGLPIVKFDGETHAWANHPDGLMTEVEYYDIINEALAK